MSEPWYYRPGDNYILDDISGFKVRRSRAQMIPGGQTGRLWVDRRRWETQHPQDFVRGIHDQQVPDVVRPRQTNQFVIVGTWVTAYAPRLSRAITVDSVDGFAVNHKLLVTLDSGDVYYPTLLAITGNTLILTPVLPHAVGGSLGQPIENTVVDLGMSDLPPFLVDDARTLITDDEIDALSGAS